jgi:hypothetical protein
MENGDCSTTFKESRIGPDKLKLQTGIQSEFPLEDFGENSVESI